MEAETTQQDSEEMPGRYVMTADDEGHPVIKEFFPYGRVLFGPFLNPSGLWDQ